MRNRRLLAIIGTAIALGAGLRAAMRRAPSIDGMIVLVTGGSRGLGLAIARELASRGAVPVVCARDRAEIDRSEFAENAEEADVRDPDGVRSMIERIIAKHGRLDAVVNNAGIISVGPASTMRRSDYEDALATHFWGAYNVVDAALPHFRARGAGRIVNVSSIGGRISVPHLLPYSVSKFALAGYSEGLYAELAPEGIAVTTVYPGLMRTGSPRNAFFRGNAEAEYTWFKVADTAPGLSVPAVRAARAIVDAMARRDASVTISPAARAGSFAHGVAPTLTMHALELGGRLLPKAQTREAEPRMGAELENRVTESPLTILGRKAEYAFNERLKEAGASPG